MTTQTPELFIYKSSAFLANDEPLAEWLKQHPIEKQWRQDWVSSACRRGYTGTWQITGNQLFLIDLADANGEVIPLSALFPECEARVLAHWFTGTIRLPDGDEIDPSAWKDWTDPSACECYHELQIENGRLTSSRIVSHHTPDSDA